tara:strand:+ start:9402 stop:9587 length:186 start_codon:yes stop_codon:yes gene_type:complete
MPAAAAGRVNIADTVALSGKQDDLPGAPPFPEFSLVRWSTMSDLWRQFLSQHHTAGHCQCA